MRELLRQVAFWFRRDRVSREIDEELQFHLAMTQRDLRDEGLSAQEAREAALRRVGSPLRVRERAAEVWIWRPLETTLQDLRFAWRMLRKQPAFTLVAASTLAIGIGANTALFTFVDALILRPPAVSQPDRLVYLFTTFRDRAFNQWSYQTYLDVQARADVFSDVAAYSGVNVTMTIDKTSDTVPAEIVTAGFFDVIGVRPVLGRGFLPDEDRAPTPVAILGDRAWRERFAADPGVINRIVALNGQAFTIVGVAPASFTGFVSERTVAVWVPMSMQPVIRPPSAALRRSRGTANLLDPTAPAWLNGIARLRPGTTVRQAQAAVVAIGHQLARQFPERNGGGGLNLARVSDGPPNLDPSVKTGLALLFAIVGLVLLIVCANVANLSLARSSARGREIAVRLALGVSRGRLVRQLLTEHLLLASIGGALGVGLAAWLIAVLPTLVPPGPRGQVTFNVDLDARMLAFALVLSLTTGVLFGLLPALAASRQDLVTTIREGSSQTGTTRSRMRRTLVVAQVAVSLLLLIAAGLFIRSLQGVTGVEPGFDRQARVLLADLNVRARGYSDAQTIAFSRALLDRLQGQPGVQTVSLSHTVPLGWSARTMTVLSEEAVARPKPRALPLDVNAITPAYFDTLGIRVLKGRAFTDRDREGTPPVVIINDVLAAELWPSQDPIGRRLSLEGPTGPLLEVIGVVPQGRYRSLGERPRPYAYTAWFQRVETLVNVFVRTSGDPVAFASTLRREVSALDPYIPVASVRSLDEHLQLALWVPRTSAVVVGVFGLIAMGLAAIGLYGLMAHAVAQRTREIGVRVALGATHHRLMLLILRDACTLTAIGLVLGIGAALALTGLLASTLYGISPRDPIAFASMALLLLMVSLVASLVPARRAMRVDPIQALRLE